MHRISLLLLSLLWVNGGACADPREKTLHLRKVSPVADPECGAPADGQTMIVRALGNFGPGEDTAQAVELGEESTFSITRFPVNTRMLEIEVRGFGGALRSIGRTAEFSFEELADGSSLPIFMAPLDGTCGTGPALVARNSPLLARSGRTVLIAGGVDGEGSPVQEVERYEHQRGLFEKVDDATYAETSRLGFAGATMTELGGGDIAIVGGAATAYQVYSGAEQQFLPPQFYREARGHHAAVQADDGRVFLAGGCAEISATGCVSSSELLTSSFLDPTTGELQGGPSLRLARIGGRAWLEGAGSILLVGGVGVDGTPLQKAERVFLDGSESALVDGVFGASAQAQTSTVWAGFSDRQGIRDSKLSVTAPGMATPAQGIAGAFADSAVSLVMLEDANLLAIGETGVQALRTLDGASRSIESPPLEGRVGQRAIRLYDGSVLVVGGLTSSAPADSFIFRPALASPLRSSASISFSSAILSEGLSARNPLRAQMRSESGAHLRLSIDDSSDEWLIVAGPRPSEFQLDIALSTEYTPVLYFGWQSAHTHWKVVANVESKPILLRVIEGQEEPIGSCSASVLGSLRATADRPAHELSLQAQGRSIRFAVDGTRMLDCELSAMPEAGHTGVGISGTAMQELRLDLISLGR